MAVQEKFYELDSAGLSAAQIAIVLGVSARTVVRWRRATGRLRRPASQPLTEEQLDQARRLLEDGASVNETARTVGCANKTLSRRWPEFAWSRAQCAEFSAIIARARKSVSTDRENGYA